MSWARLLKRVLEDLLENPRLKDVGFFERREHPTEGTIINMRLPNEWSCGVRRDWNPAPRIGQHSVEVLREAGLTESEIEAMLQSGAAVDAARQREEARRSASR